jgi:hypothetical protein
MGTNRFYGLDSLEWWVTLAGSALIALAAWLI